MTAELLDALHGVPFSKGHGTGNDFVIVADPDAVLPFNAELTQAVCDRYRGIGGDGFIRAVRAANLPEGVQLLTSEPKLEWFMDYRNSDGSLAQMCGNGVRVFAEFLLNQGLADIASGELIPIGTRAGVKYVERRADGYAVDMGPWGLIFPQQASENGLDALVTAYSLDVSRPGLSVDIGNPHTVVALATQEELDELDLSRPPRVDPIPEAGSNVEFALPRDPLVVDGVAGISMRVHERGSGETLSCGTGACAAAAASRFWAGEGAPDKWQVQVLGGQVEVHFFLASDGKEHVELAGPARIVAHGRFGAAEVKTS